MYICIKNIFTIYSFIALPPLDLPNDMGLWEKIGATQSAHIFTRKVFFHVLKDREIDLGAVEDEFFYSFQKSWIGKDYWEKML